MSWKLSGSRLKPDSHRSVKFFLWYCLSNLIEPVAVFLIAAVHTTPNRLSGSKLETSFLKLALCHELSWFTFATVPRYAGAPRLGLKPPLPLAHLAVPACFCPLEEVVAV